MTGLFSRRNAMHCCKILLCLPILIAVVVAQVPKQTPLEQARGVARKYVELRLRGARWDEFSKLITWLDEPAWDIYRVCSKYSIGVARMKGKTAIVPVTYSRIGYIDSNLRFETDVKVLTIRTNQDAFRVEGLRTEI
jgi:hypothetical protein